MKKLLIALLLQAVAPDSILDQIAESGRIVTIAESPSDRIAVKPSVAPGQPPLLSFRYLEGKRRGRYANLDLVLDDAGH